MLPDPPPHHDRTYYLDVPQYLNMQPWFQENVDPLVVQNQDVTSAIPKLLRFKYDHFS